MPDKPITSERISILETKVEYIDNNIEQIQNRLSTVNDKMDNISIQVIQQSVILPRLETGLNKLLDRVEQQEKEQTGTTLKTKIIWGIFISIITGSIIACIKVILG